MISAIRDITERKRAERMQQDFIAMASHDLLTPVTVVRARAQLLQRRHSYDEASVASILEQASRMERLITDLRELVLVEGGRLALRREPVDLAEIVHEALIRARAQGTAACAADRGAAVPIVGSWDRDRLGQVLDNLIDNAIKYSPQGGEISVQVEATDAEGRVRIEDHGIGIAADVLPRLFERFYQGQDPGVSTGLGLGSLHRADAGRGSWRPHLGRVGTRPGEHLCDLPTMVILWQRLCSSHCRLERRLLVVSILSTVSKQ